MKKLALFLAAVLLIAAVLPAPALAASKNSGKFGKLKWKLTPYEEEDYDNCYTLTLSGKGGMKDLDWDSSEGRWVGAPWLKRNEDDNDENDIRIVRAVIKKGVTSIGDGVFSDLEDLREVKLPEGLKRIGEYAFAGCSCLEELTLPESVTSIREGAFWGCEMLADEHGLIIVGNILFQGVGYADEVEIPAGVKRIEESAFEGNGRLTRVTIPASVKRIGECAFEDCEKLRTVSYAGTEEQWEKIALGEDAIPRGVTILFGGE